MYGRHSATPVGSQGLKPVGSPNRIQRRSGQGPGSPKFSSPQFQRGTDTTPQSSNARSSFAERVYQINGGRRGNAVGPGPLFGSPGSPSGQFPEIPLSSPSRGAPVTQSGLRDYSQQRAAEGQGSASRQGEALPQDPADAQPGRNRAAPPPPPPPAPSKGISQSGSAIPTSVLDLPSQRMYALAILVLLLAWKLYDAIDLSLESDTPSLYLFLKWSILDTALWSAGWRLHIPRFSISARASALLTAASVFLNLNLFLLPVSIFTLALKPMAIGVASGCMRSIKNIPWIGPKLVGDSDLLIDSFELNEEHILGRHTIHILPHSLAHMNPHGRGFCIDEAAKHSEPWYRRFTSGLISHQHGQQTAIPILINGTHPASITYAHTSFETGEKQLHVVKNVNNLQIDVSTVYPTLGNWVLATYYLPVKETGAYELHSVKDAKGLEFRTATHAPPTIVVARPSARLQWRAGSANSGDNFAIGSDGQASICQRVDPDTPGASESSQDGLVEAIAEGYEPLEMTIVRLVNGHRETIGLDSIKPRLTEDVAPPAARDGLNATQRAALEKWTKYRARRVTYILSDAFLRPGEYVYKLESVRDAANHTMHLSDAGANSMFDGDKAKSSSSAPYLSRIQVHRRPSVEWSGSILQGDLPLRLSDDRQRRSRYSLPLRLSGQGPWTVDYEIADGSDNTRETKTFAVADKAAIDAGKPGVYRLLGVRDKHCSGASGNANVTLVHTPKPSIVVKASPITARECGGEIGAQIELELTGRPPFTIHYRERNLRFPNSKPISRVVRTHQRRHNFKVTPDLAGTYELVFYRLDDDNYPSGQKVDATIQQSVHAQPSAKLDTVSGDIPSNACMGQSLALPVRFKGQGPWDLTYAVVHENRRRTMTLEGVTDERHTIELGPFSDAGEYTVELVQVTDGNKCARDLLDVSATVSIRESGPRAGFQCPEGGIRILDGDQARIPVQVVGEFPVELKYRKIGDKSDRTFRASIPRPSAHSTQPYYVLAYGPGEYELTAADDFCPGTVDAASSRCVVRVEPKPAAWFVTDGLRYNDVTKRDSGVWQLGDACEGTTSPGSIELGLSGSGPWKIQYSVEFWATSNPNSGDSRFADRSTQHTSVALQPSTLKVDAREPGLYRYTLTAVHDERYQAFQPLAANRDASAPGGNVTVVEHRVTKSPVAELRAYLPDGTPLDVSSSQSTFRRKQRAVKHCLAPGQSKNEGDAQTWAKVRDHLPVFRIEFDKQGKPPFQAWVEVFPVSGPSEVVQVHDIESFAEVVSLPERIASKIGRYHMRLVKTRDSRGCEHQFVDPSSVGLGRPDRGSKAIEGGIEIEYIEAPTARPAPSSPAANPSKDVCVGDILAFDLRGLNSWNVEYTYNGFHRTTPVSKRLFRRIADVPGNFTLNRVCHRSTNDCCSNFADLSYAVHDIPRVLVSGGKDVYQDILEGDMVEIRMDLVGTPPFTFTWQRRGLDYESGGAGKVLESHTVKDLDAFSYTITASSEGTFEVTFVQDRYCQYPKA
ncbi:hypothetical protein GQ54DRAFT_321350 [Martensiomyces pterosporus]|nr:hypothetical protein GQ54DRAFT_321350 [Martensiomyces pterosporus]